MKYPPAPLTLFFASLPLTRPHRFLRHARPSRTAQALSAGASIASLRALELSCVTFCGRCPFFSIVCALFCKNTRGMGYPGPIGGLSAGVDEDSRCRRPFCALLGLSVPLRHLCVLCASAVSFAVVWIAPLFS